MDIKTVRPLSPGRPVFLLVGLDDSHVVIKSELAGSQHDPTNLKFANRAMRTVNPAFSAKVFTPGEVQVLKEVVSWEQLIADLLSTPLPAEIDYLNNSLASGGVWFKMEKAEGILGLDSAVEKARQQNDKSGIRQITAAFRSPGGLETLGRIISADLFNGNADRFNPFISYKRDGTRINVGVINPRTENTPAKSKLAVLLNVGNVLISMQNNQHRPIGLDAYEASGQWRHMDMTIAQIEQREGTPWPGRHLRNDPNEVQWRTNFAALVVADLEAVLGPRNRKILGATKRRLPKNAVTRIVAGMDAGINDLRITFTQYVRKQGKVRPAGLTDRLTILGW